MTTNQTRLQVIERGGLWYVLNRRQQVAGPYTAAIQANQVRNEMESASTAAQFDTKAHIENVIRANMEDTDRSDRLYEALAKYEGKSLTEPLVDKIRTELGENIRIRRQYGMTHLEVGGYGNEQDPDRGMTWLLAHSEANVRIDLAYIQEHNRGYLGAAKKNNEQRKLALEDRNSELQSLADAIDSLIAARAKIRELFAYGSPLSVDSIAIEKEFGLDK